MYVLADGGTIKKFPYSPEQLSVDINATLPYPISNELLAEFNVYPVVTTDPPQFDENTFYADITGCAYDDTTGEYNTIWTVRELTEEELDSRIPHTVTMAQFRKALHINKKLISVTEFMRLPESDDLFSIDWEYATEVTRKSPLSEYIKEFLSISTKEMNDIFKLASEL